jgi:fructose-1,6-bisphosphatase
MTQTTESELREKYLDLLSQQFDSPEYQIVVIINLNISLVIHFQSFVSSNFTPVWN